VSALVLRVCSVRHATASARIIRVDLGGAAFSYEPGQVAVIRPEQDDLGVPYSIASAPAETSRTGCLEFLTRLEPASRLGDVKRGSRIVVDGPFGSFTFPKQAAERNVLFVAGGTGIAPLRSMIQQAVLTRRRGRMHLLYSARSPADFAYLAELRQLARLGHLDLALTATREVPPRWRGDRGRITKERLAPLLDTAAMLCFVCGPMAMVDEVPRMLVELGIDRKMIRIEEW
jgi:ferredoxin-NADP reductase